MNNSQLRWLGSGLASLNMLIGCVVFVASEVLPTPMGTETQILQTGILIVWLALSCALFALPFSMIGGYAMTWLLQKVQWHQFQSSRVVLSGAIIALTGLLSCFVIAVVSGACVQGDCSGNLGTDVQGIFHDAVTMKLLFIAAVCGGVTALQLSRSAQRETA